MEEYSFSKISRFDECPLSYMRKYINEEEPDNHGVTEGGSFMHDILEKYEHGELTIDELVPYYERHFDEWVVDNTVLDMGKGFKKDMYSLYYKGYHEYLENFTGIPECKEIIDVEKEFHLPYKDYPEQEEFLIQGKIDLTFRDNDDKLIVLDHKSKNKFKSKKDQYHYARQLYLYAWASKTLYGQYPDVLVFNMLRGKIIYISFNIDDMYEALHWFSTNVEEIRNTITFDAKCDTFYCNNFCLLGRDELCEM